MVSRYLILFAVLLLTACGLKLVKDEKYIDTKTFQEEVYTLCMKRGNFRSQSPPGSETACQEDARRFIASAEKKFREYKADEHSYRLCKAKFAHMVQVDKCFREKQESYYRREVSSYQ